MSLYSISAQNQKGGVKKGKRIKGRKNKGRKNNIYWLLLRIRHNVLQGFSHFYNNLLPTFKLKGAYLNNSQILISIRTFMFQIQLALVNLV